MQEYCHHDLFNILERNDFIRFAPEFLQAMYANIPTLESVTFLDPVLPQPADSTEESSEGRRVREAVQEAADTSRPVFTPHALYLPFSVEETTVIAELKGLDEYLIRKVGNDWLESLQLLLLRDFLLIKRANIDPLTGLLSSLHLNESLNINRNTSSEVLVLLSVSPRGSNAFYARSYLNKTVSLLKGFINERFPLYYIGQSCFAMLCKTTEQNFSSEFSPLLVNFFKREACSRVHVATLDLAHFDFNHDTSISASEAIMKKAWAALHTASKRGPFAFCNASALENLAAHPLAPPEKLLKRWLQSVTRKNDHFSLLQFTGGDEKLLKIIQDETESKGESTIFGDHSYLFLPMVDRKRLKKIAEKIIAVHSQKATKERTPNVGIAIYSTKEPSKSDMLLNCRKALCHAAFFEPGSVVICDAVSFNISGDIYYGEGDLVRAVREYKRGLILDSRDGNLLNSLGVCYAQMNRHKDAVLCFKKACTSRDDRFMALYNLGLELQQHKDKPAAIKSFTSALACSETDNQEVARKDISFQLSVLCCQEKLYKKGLALLQPWYDHEADGKALKYLGQLHGGLGNYKKAMKYLQLAMRYDEYDAEVLGLLGEIYLEENEGDDSALRFCEKAVELNPDSLQLKIRLAKSQIHCGELTAAVKTFQRGLRNKKTRLAALQQKAILANEQGKNKTAAKWHAKAEQFAAKIEGR